MVPGQSGLYARGEREPVIVLESWEGLKPNKNIRDRVWKSSVSREEMQLAKASRTVPLPLAGLRGLSPGLRVNDKAQVMNV